MSVEAFSSQNRSRFLVIHDATVSVEKRGPFRDVCMALTDRGADVHVIQTDGTVSAEQLARDAVACQGYDAVACAGVEETLSEVVTGLAQSGVPLGLLPSDNGSDLVGQLGLTGKPPVIAETLAAGPAASFPGLFVNAAPLRMMVGVGSDGDVLARLSRHLRPGASKGKSSLMLAKNLVRRVERFDAVVDGMNYRCCCLFVMRSDGFAALTGAGEVQSGAAGPLTAVLVEADDRVALFDVLCLAKVGRLLQNRIVNVRQCQHVQVPGGQDLTFEFDGKGMVNADLAAAGFQVVANPQPLQVICAPDVASRLLPASTHQAAA